MKFTVHAHITCHIPLEFEAKDYVDAARQAAILTSQLGIEELMETEHYPASDPGCDHESVELSVVPADSEARAAASNDCWKDCRVLDFAGKEEEFYIQFTKEQVERFVTNHHYETGAVPMGSMNHCPAMDRRRLKDEILRELVGVRLD